MNFSTQRTSRRPTAAAERDPGRAAPRRPAVLRILECVDRMYLTPAEAGPRPRAGGGAATRVRGADSRAVRQRCRRRGCRARTDGRSRRRGRSVSPRPRRARSSSRATASVATDGPTTTCPAAEAGGRPAWSQRRKRRPPPGGACRSRARSSPGARTSGPRRRGSAAPMSGGTFAGDAGKAGVHVIWLDIGAT